MALEELEEELKDTKLVEGEKLSRKEIIRKAVKFMNEARKHYGEIIKSIVIFGSAARGEVKKGSDIDLWVIVDDTATKSTEDLEKVSTQLYLIAKELKDLHIQITSLTEFWEWMKKGSPELVNFLRYSLPLYDSGFVKPVKRLLELGLISPSEETVRLKTKACEARLKKVKLDIQAMIFDLRYCAMDIIQAVVMYYYKAQPDHKKIPEFLEKLVKEGKLEEEYIEKFRELNKLWKDIEHKIIKEVGVEHLKRALELAEEIADRFKKLLPEEIIGE